MAADESDFLRLEGDTLIILTRTPDGQDQEVHVSPDHVNALRRHLLFSTPVSNANESQDDSLTFGFGGTALSSIVPPPKQNEMDALDDDFKGQIKAAEEKKRLRIDTPVPSRFGASSHALGSTGDSLLTNDGSFLTDVSTTSTPNNSGPGLNPLSLHGPGTALPKIEEDEQEEDETLDDTDAFRTANEGQDDDEMPSSHPVPGELLKPEVFDRMKDDILRCFPLNDVRYRSIALRPVMDTRYKRIHFAVLDIYRDMVQELWKDSRQLARLLEAQQAAIRRLIEQHTELEQVICRIQKAMEVAQTDTEY